jgi:chromosome segregation ATPase
MVVDDRRRLAAFERLTDAVGEETSRTIFEMLAEVGPGVASDGDVQDVRTQVGALAVECREEFAEIRQRFAEVDQRFDRVDQRFVEVDQRFEQVDQRFEQIDQRFGQVDRRFEQIDQRFEQVDRRFEQVDQRFADVDRRFGQVDHRFDLLDARFESLEHRLVATFESGLRQALTSQTRLVILSLLAAFFVVSALALGIG